MKTNESGKRQQAETPLGSWKEIGAYLLRDARTVRRWEKEEGLPVHRHAHRGRSSVYAYPSEIDAWKLTRRLAPEPPPVRPWRQTLAIGVTTSLCLIMVGNGIRPQVVSAQQTGQSARQIWTGPGVDDSGTVSADGRYLSFTSYATGDLAVRDLVTGTNRLLTHTGGWQASGDYTARSVISPDGNQIVYHWAANKEDGGNELRVLRLDGDGPPRTLYPSDKSLGDYILPYGWTPDGKSVLALRSLPDHTNQLVMISVESRALTVIKSLGWLYASPALSPDGRFIAYAPGNIGSPGPADIAVLAVDGTRETWAVQGPSDDIEPQWSPDGSRLLFLSDRTGSYSLWSVAMENGKPKGAPALIKADVGKIRPLGVTRKGSFYYRSRSTGGSNLYAAEIDSAMKAAKEPALVTQKFLNHNVGPSLSPDRKKLAYYSARPATGGVLVVRTVETSVEREFALPFPVLAVYGEGPAWFPDGHSVLVTLQDPQQPGLEYYRFDLASGKLATLLRTSAYPDIQGWALAPDGKAIFYADPKLVRFDIQTRRETELQNQWVIEMAVSPDSQQIAYRVATKNSGSFLAVQPAIGGPVREIFRDSSWSDGRSRALAWSPDQRYLIFARGGTSSATLWRVPLDGGQPETMGISMPGGIHSLQLTPDGGRILFSADQGNVDEVWALENFIPSAAGGK